jgi:Tol biopolymer transport system component
MEFLGLHEKALSWQVTKELIMAKKLFSFFIILALSSLLLVSCQPASTPTLSPTPSSVLPPDISCAISSYPELKGKIVFSIDHDIYTINADGSDLTRLTYTKNNSFPIWSPDGKKIAFMEEWGKSKIRVMNADGSQLITLLASGVPPVSWLDNQKIAFSDHHNYYVINTDGSERTRLDTLGPDNIKAIWSLDGEKIAFIDSKNELLYVMDADGSDRTQLTTEKVEVFAWSPDGQKIAYRDNEDEHSIIVKNTDGTLLTKLQRYSNLIILNLAWSPDGTQIIVDEGAVIAHRLNIVNSDLTSEITLISGCGARDPSWTK